MKKKIPTGNRDMIRAINRSIILNKIKAEGEISRAQIARETDLSPATLTAITSELISEGLVYEKEAGVSSGGRRPMLLSLVPTGGYVIGIKIKKHSLRLVLADFKATLLKHKVVDFTATTPLYVAGMIEQSVNRMLKEYDIERQKLLGIGIGIAGRVNFQKGVVLQTPLFDWDKTQLRALVSEKLNIPIYLDNDVNTLALAEQHFGEGVGFANFLTISIGRGLGMGLVMNGVVCRGADSAGELGHIVINPQGKKCQCGKVGCLETVVSIPAILEAINTKNDTALETLSELKEFNSGDESVQIVLREAGGVLGMQLANLAVLLGPERIIISGEGVELDPGFYQAVEAAFYTSIGQRERLPEIIIQKWEEESWARGAAYLVFDILFHSPQFHHSF